MRDLHNLVEQYYNDIIRHRRYIHQHPELSNMEFETTAYICKVLEHIHIPYERLPNTGVVGFIKGSCSIKKIAFRADIDALPIDEENDVDYKSVVKNCMHACGHDMHTAILLGVAYILKEYEQYLGGDVVLVFQPAEETPPDGGAKRVIESGFLDGIDFIYGLHVWPDANVGELLLKNGALMAASDCFKVNIEGKSAHAAQPHKGVDALVAGAYFVSALQNIVAREINPFDNVVISVGTMNSGTKNNIISQNTLLEGTCRTLSENMRDIIEHKIKNILKANDILFNTKSVLEYERGYPALINDKESVDFVQNTALKYGLKYQYTNEPSMCGEDYAFYLERHKGAFVWLGTGYNGCAPLHHPKFNPDESIMKTGVLLFCALACEYLLK